jgi:hypothetical protein
MPMRKNMIRELIPKSTVRKHRGLLWIWTYYGELATDWGWMSAVGHFIPSGKVLVAYLCLLSRRPRT